MPSRSDEPRRRVRLPFTVVILHVVSINAPIFACRHVHRFNYDAQEMNVVPGKDLYETAQCLPGRSPGPEYADGPVAVNGNLNRIRNRQHWCVVHQHKVELLPGSLQYLLNFAGLEKFRGKRSALAR